MAHYATLFTVGAVACYCNRAFRVSLQKVVQIFYDTQLSTETVCTYKKGLQNIVILCPFGYSYAFLLNKKTVQKLFAPLLLRTT